MQNPVLLPMFIHMGLSFAILIRLVYGRLTAIKAAGGIAEIRKKGFAAPVVNAGDNFRNQFETPTIFYALCVLLVALQVQSEAITYTAWVYVICRILHALVHLTNNIIFPYRFVTFLLSILSLFGLFFLTAQAVL